MHCTRVVRAGFFVGAEIEGVWHYFLFNQLHLENKQESKRESGGGLMDGLRRTMRGLKKFKEAH